VSTLYDYFEQITNRLTLDDLEILTHLQDNEATATFKALKNQKLFELSKLSEAKYRKTISKLTSILFVETDTSEREHSLYITTYGLAALRKSLLE
jgi:RIO-like serine/threonine protein kinase